MQEIQKPISIIRKELIDGIRYIINDSHLPPYVVSPILKDIITELDIATENQYRTDMAEYQRKLKEQTSMERDDVTG